MVDRNLINLSHPDRGQDVLSQKQIVNLEKSIGICAAQAQKLTTLLEELLDLTRIRSGKLELVREPVDLVQVTRDMVNRLSDGSGLSHLISISTSAVSITGKWDLSRIEQIVTNLLTNAIKYGEAKPISIHLSIDETSHQAVLTVKDQGMGIPPELQEKIFERFQRGVGPTKITGLGLGLYIVRQTVEAHQGKVSVQSKLGSGSTFTVTLPLTSSEMTQ